MIFNNKSILITGGTGSFGSTMLKQVLSQGFGEVRIFSRDENKQDQLRREYQDSNIKFFIGDVRDYRSVLDATRGADYVFHAAALKQVPSCEFFPLEAIKTNILGTDNVLEAAISCGVRRVVCLSTDKAVYPINAMGASKSLMEKVALAKARNNKKTVITITRYGNVIGSRGSVIPLFIHQIKNGLDITITDPNMTRFMMTLDDAVELVLHALSHGAPGEIFVQKAPATSIGNLTKVIKNLYRVPDHPCKVIGTRHGEKLFETLLSREEMSKAIDQEKYFCIPPDFRDLNYSNYVNSGSIQISSAEEYNSHNTLQMTESALMEMLQMQDFIHTDK